METKICSKCGRELPITEFHWRNKQKGTRRAECKDCHNGHMHKSYLKKKEQADGQKAVGCQKCGYNKCLDALDFHHLNPDEKEFAIAKMIRDHRSEQCIQEEMSKCIILCSNCHREFHWLEREHGITIEEFLLE